MVAMAKVFMNGASQALRLPKEFRFAEKEVCIKRIGKAVLLFPKDAAWELMKEAIEGDSEDFMVKREQPKKTERRKGLERKKGKRQ